MPTRCAYHARLKASKGSDDSQAYTFKIRRQTVSEGRSYHGFVARGTTLIESITREDNP